MRIGFCGAAALFVLSAFASTAANAQLTFYTSRPAFDTANPGLPVEGFQNARTPNTTGFDGPLSSATNNAAFHPGDILPGITLERSSGPGTSDLFLAAAGFNANPTLAVGVNQPSSDALVLTFAPGVNGVAFDLFQNFGGGSQSGSTESYAVQVFGVSGLLGSTTVGVPSGGIGFFGVSDVNLGEITSISVNNPNAFEVVDNVAFGNTGAAPAVPEPSSVALLIGLGVSGASFLARRRRR